MTTERKSLIRRIRWKLIVWTARRLPPCCHISHRLSDSLQERPPFRERVVIRLHLLVCEWCTRYAQQINLLQDAVRRQAHNADLAGTSMVQMSPETRERLRAMLKRDSN